MEYRLLTFLRVYSIDAGCCHQDDPTESTEYSIRIHSASKTLTQNLKFHLIKKPQWFFTMARPAFE